MSDVSHEVSAFVRGELQPLGHETLVTGGSGPAAKFFLGQLAEMQEKNWVRQRLSLRQLSPHRNCSTPDSSSGPARTIKRPRDRNRAVDD